MSEHLDKLYTELEKTKNEKEPAVKIGTILTAVSTIGAVIGMFFPGEPPKSLQVATTVCVILIPLLTSILIRYKVWSPHSVNAILEDISAAHTTLEEIQKRNRPISQDFLNADANKTFFGGDPYEVADSQSAFDTRKETTYDPPAKKRPESLDDYGKPMPDIQHDPEDGPF